MAAYPLGFKYGPDAKMFSLGLDLSVLPLNLNISAEYNLLKGLVNDGGIIRWKWFWDSWPYNVTEGGTVMPMKAEDAMYDIFSFEVKWKNFSAFGKIVNLNNYIFGLMINF